MPPGPSQKIRTAKHSPLCAMPDPCTVRRGLDLQDEASANWHQAQHANRFSTAPDRCRVIALGLSFRESPTCACGTLFRLIAAVEAQDAPDLDARKCVRAVPVPSSCHNIRTFKECRNRLSIFTKPRGTGFDRHAVDHHRSWAFREERNGNISNRLLCSSSQNCVSPCGNARSLPRRDALRTRSCSRLPPPRDRMAAATSVQLPCSRKGDCKRRNSPCAASRLSYRPRPICDRSCNRKRRRQRAARDDADGQVLDQRQAEGGDQHAGRAPVAQQAKRTPPSPPCSSTPPPARRPAPTAGQSSPGAPRRIMNTSTNNACTMPETGLQRAGADIGRGARDRAGHADAAEQGRGDVGDALRHHLHIVAVLAPGHAVGHLGGQQALDRRPAA